MSREMTTCMICERVLTDPVSVYYRAGRACRQKMTAELRAQVIAERTENRTESEERRVESDGYRSELDDERDHLEECRDFLGSELLHAVDDKAPALREVAEALVSIDLRNYPLQNQSYEELRTHFERLNTNGITSPLEAFESYTHTAFLLSKLLCRHF